MSILYAVMCEKLLLKVKQRYCQVSNDKGKEKWMNIISGDMRCRKKMMMMMTKWKYHYEE